MLLNVVIRIIMIIEACILLDILYITTQVELRRF